MEPPGIHSRKILKCVSVRSNPRYCTMLGCFSFCRVRISPSSSLTHAATLCLVDASVEFSCSTCTESTSCVMYLDSKLKFLTPATTSSFSANGQGHLVRRVQKHQTSTKTSTCTSLVAAINTHTSPFEQYVMKNYDIHTASSTVVKRSARA